MSAVDWLGLSHVDGVPTSIQDSQPSVWVFLSCSLRACLVYVWNMLGYVWRVFLIFSLIKAPVTNPFFVFHLYGSFSFFSLLQLNWNCHKLLLSLAIWTDSSSCLLITNGLSCAVKQIRSKTTLISLPSNALAYQHGLPLSCFLKLLSVPCWVAAI